MQYKKLRSSFLKYLEKDVLESDYMSAVCFASIKGISNMANYIIFNNKSKQIKIIKHSYFILSIAFNQLNTFNAIIIQMTKPNKKNKNFLSTLLNYPLSLLKQVEQQLSHSTSRVKECYQKIEMDQFQINSEQLIKENDPLRSSIKYSTYVPIIIESYIWLHFIYSFYTILKTIVLIPVDFIVAIFNFILDTFRFYKSKYLTIHSLFIMVSAFLITRNFHFLDISIMYHLLRGQSAVKLYALIFALENGQKLLTKVGTFLFCNIRQKIGYSKFYSLKVMPQCCASVLYVVLHSYTIFIQFLVYTVVLNSSMQNFIVFWSVIYLTRMKSMPSQKFVEEEYRSILSSDSKYRLCRLLYLVMFQLSQMERQIPSFGYKLFFILFVQQAFQLGKHTLNLISGDKDRSSLKVRQKMYNSLYIQKQKGSIERCIGQQFTILPFAVFILKMLKIIIQANYTSGWIHFAKIYLLLLALMIIIRVLIFFVTKFVRFVNFTKTRSRILRSFSIVQEQESIQQQDEKNQQNLKKKN